MVAYDGQSPAVVQTGTTDSWPQHPKRFLQCFAHFDLGKSTAVMLPLDKCKFFKHGTETLLVC
jgi:hypothetical protein